MQTRGLLLAGAILAALCVVFYSGANRQVEIVLIIVFVVLLSFGFRFTPISSELDGVRSKRTRTAMCWVFAATS